jgi:hypothetical protein
VLNSMEFAESFVNVKHMPTKPPFIVLFRPYDHNKKLRVCQPPPSRLKKFLDAISSLLRAPMCGTTSCATLRFRISDIYNA